MPADWLMTDLQTRKIKLRFIKSTVFGIGILPFSNSKDPDMYLDPYQSEKSFRIRIKVKSRIWIRIKMVWIRSNYPFKK
jgi:hypothetical protein